MDAPWPGPRLALGLYFEATAGGGLKILGRPWLALGLALAGPWPGPWLALGLTLAGPPPKRKMKNIKNVIWS